MCSGESQVPTGSEDINTEESLKALLHCGLTKNKLLRIEVEDLSKKAWQKLNSEDNKQ